MHRVCVYGVTKNDYDYFKSRPNRVRMLVAGGLPSPGDVAILQETKNGAKVGDDCPMANNTGRYAIGTIAGAALSIVNPEAPYVVLELRQLKFFDALERDFEFSQAESERMGVYL